MRKQRARAVAPTVIIQQSAAEPIDRNQPEGDLLKKLAEMLAQEQAKAAAPPEPQILDVKEAAAYLRVSPWTIRDMLRTNSITFFRVRSRIFFRRDDLDQWIASQLNKPGAVIR